MKINPFSNLFKTHKTEKAKGTAVTEKRIEDEVTLTKNSEGDGYLQETSKVSFLKSLTGAFGDIAENIGITGKEETPSVEKETAFNTAEPKEWNILIYMAGDNTLEESMASNLLSLEKVGSDDKTNILVQFDRGMRQHRGVSPWDGTKRFYITKEDKPEISSKVEKDLGDTDTSRPENLTDFIVEAHKKYPAKHTLIIVSNHGGGFTGLANDDTSKTVMNIPDMEKALKDAKDALGKDKFDIVGFDCCLMGQAEVAYQIKDHVGIMIGSEETEGKEGWPYRRILDGGDNVINVIKSTINKEKSVKPEELAKKIVEEAAGTQSQVPTLSAIDLKKMDTIAKLSSGFADEVKKVPGSLDIIRKIANKTESYSKVIPFIEPYGQYRDMVDFFQKIVDSPELNKDEYREIKNQATKLLPAIKEAIIAEQSSDLYKDSHGLSMYIPTDKPKPKKYGYDKTKWARDTQWDEMLVSDRSMMTFTAESLLDMLGMGEKWTYTPPPLFDEETVRKNQGK